MARTPITHPTVRTLAVTGLCCIAATAQANTYLYVSLAGERKIAVYQIDERHGTLTHQRDIPTEDEPGALVTDPQSRFLFASLRPAGKLSAYRIGPKSATLTHVNTVTAGPDPAHLSTDRDGRFLFSAYYVAAKATVHAIGRDGTLSSDPLQTIPTVEKAHAIVLAPKQRFAFVPHTGPNLIYQFTYRSKSGELRPATVPILETPAGTGPRHLVFHPAKDLAYVVNEQGSSVTVYRLDTTLGTLRPLQTVPTVPNGFRSENACAEIKIHPTGKYLYASNRGHDSIACFRIDPKDGTLTGMGQARTEQTPRSFDLDPEGRFLYAAGEGSGKLAVYWINPKSGELQPVTTYEVGKRPWWVLAVKVHDDRG